MSDLDIDRIIDDAAEGLVMREPSRSLGPAVRDRVTGRSRSRRTGLGVPVAVAIAAALFVVVFVTSNDTPPSPVGAQQERDVTSEPTTVQDAPPKETATAERPASQAERIATRVPRRATAPVSPVDAAESITTFESIEPGPIEMDDVIIEPLVVEPLTN